MAALLAFHPSVVRLRLILRPDGLARVPHVRQRVGQGGAGCPGWPAARGRARASVSPPYSLVSGTVKLDRGKMEKHAESGCDNSVGLRPSRATKWDTL